MGTARLIKRTTIIGDGGEVLEQQDILISQRSSPMFIKLYPDGYRKFLSIKDCDWKIFCACISYLEKDTSRFRLDKGKRQEMSILCGKKVNTINMSISRLVKLQLIFRESRSTYYVSDEVVYNGKETRKKFNK